MYLRTVQLTQIGPVWTGYNQTPPGYFLLQKIRLCGKFNEQKNTGSVSLVMQTVIKPGIEPSDHNCTFTMCATQISTCTMKACLLPSDSSKEVSKIEMSFENSPTILLCASRRRLVEEWCSPNRTFEQNNLDPETTLCYWSVSHTPNRLVSVGLRFVFHGGTCLTDELTRSQQEICSFCPNLSMVQ